MLRVGCDMTATATLKLFSYLNFHLLKVVSRYRDPQLQGGENCVYLVNSRPNIKKMDA